MILPLKTHKLMPSHFSQVQSCVTHGLQPTRLLCQWDFPGKNAGVGSLFLTQRELPDPGIQPGSSALHVDSLPAELPGKYHARSLEGYCTWARKRVEHDLTVKQ